MSRYTIEVEINPYDIQMDVGFLDISIANRVDMYFSFVHTQPQASIEVYVDRSITVTTDNFIVSYEAAYKQQSDTYFRRDYNVFIIEVDSDTVPTYTTNTEVVVTITEVVAAYNVQSLTYPFGVSSLPCSKVLARIITTKDTVALLQPYLDETLSSTTNTIILDRGIYNQLIEIKSIDDDIAIHTFEGVPPSINPNSIVIDITSEYDIVVSFYSEGVLFVEYSLNDETYQESNIFLGLDIGSNNIKIKDEFGCIVEKQFIVDQYIPSTIPELYVSKSNSFRFKEVNNLLPNDNNLLSRESLDGVVYGSIQYYNAEEVITTQVKSNIEPTATINGTNLNVDKLSNNIGVTECIEAKNYIRGLNDSLFYFTTGYYKDCNTGVLLDEYEFNGTLPEWVVLGQKITINGQDVTIISIEFISKINAIAFQCSSAYFAPTEDIKVVYNKEEYEVYEFNTIMDEYKNLDSFCIDITATSQVSVGLYKSEPVKVIDTSDMVKVEYWMDRNTDMFYASGIRNIQHHQLKKSVALSDGNIDDYKTDTDIIQISQELFEVEEFTFEPIPKENARKLQLAIIHNNVIINDIGYKAKELPSIEAQGDSNLYVVVAVMYKGTNDIAVNRFYDYSTMIPKLVENKPTNFIAQ